jgi:hypothetical protein
MCARRTYLSSVMSAAVLLAGVLLTTSSSCAQSSSGDVASPSVDPGRRQPDRRLESDALRGRRRRAG